MIPAAIPRSGKTNQWRSGDAWIQAPAATAISRATVPNAVTPRIASGRMRRSHSPMASAIGIVSPMLNTPHALCLSEFTTTSAIAAIATVMTNTMAIAVAVPVSGLTCSRAMLASERPWLRTEAVRMTKSCTPPANTEPTSNHRNPGR